MKIAEETGDGDLKEQAKVNFGMANASMKWTNHVSNILNNLNTSGNPDGNNTLMEEDEEEAALDDEPAEGVKFPQIASKTR
jgi:hypothetical protein